MTEAEKQDLLDAEHLRLLRLGYLIAGFSNAVWALFPLIHVSLGLVMLAGTFPGSTGKEAPDARFMVLFFVAIGGTISLMLGAIATLKLITARRLRERRSKTFCLITAGLSCLGLPYGTALGVFTFMVLSRPSVSRAFDGQHPNANSTPPAV
jgi:hypothetical protein